MLRLIDGVKELRIPVAANQPEREPLSDTVPDRVEWEFSPEILGIAGYKMDAHHSA